MTGDSKSSIAKPEPHSGTVEISRRIHTIRGQRVMLDADLADLYGFPPRYSIRQSGGIATGFPTISCSALPRRSSIV